HWLAVTMMPETTCCSIRTMGTLPEMRRKSNLGSLQPSRRDRTHDKKSSDRAITTDTPRDGSREWNGSCDEYRPCPNRVSTTGAINTKPAAAEPDSNVVRSGFGPMTALWSSRQRTTKKVANAQKT